MSADDVAVAIAWCSDPGEAQELGRFFAENITPEYISHSELQGPRALDVGRWHPDIVGVLQREIADRVGRERGRIDAEAASYPILAARRAGRPVGLAFVSFFPAASVPYGIVEDVVVEQGGRSRGLGKRILDWITEEAVRAGCKRLFLESGVGNDDAHHFFEREGFSTCSIVMMKPLKPT